MDKTLLTAVELLFSIGSRRPDGLGLSRIVFKTDAELVQAQREHDAVVTEMKRRKSIGKFPFEIPS